MSAKSSNIWDAAADRELFLAILTTQNVTVDYQAVAKYLSKDGKVYTVSAIQNRMKKLKKMVKNGGADAGDDEETPKSGRKRGAEAALDGETPIKKCRTSKKASKTATAEGDDERLRRLRSSRRMRMGAIMSCLDGSLCFHDARKDAMLG